jgi:hypothetical protein
MYTTTRTIVIQGCYSHSISPVKAYNLRSSVCRRAGGTARRAKPIQAEDHGHGPRVRIWLHISIVKFVFTTRVYPVRVTLLPPLPFQVGPCIGSPCSNSARARGTLCDTVPLPRTIVCIKS